MTKLERWLFGMTMTFAGVIVLLLAMPTHGDGLLVAPPPPADHWRIAKIEFRRDAAIATFAYVRPDGSIERLEQRTIADAAYTDFLQALAGRALARDAGCARTDPVTGATVINWRCVVNLRMSDWIAAHAVISNASSDASVTYSETLFAQPDASSPPPITP